MSDLLTSIHPALNTDPIPDRVISFAPTINGFLDLSATTLTFYQDTETPIVLSLNQTINDLIAALPVDLNPLLIQSAWGDVSAYSLIELQSTIENGKPIYLEAYTAPLWRVIKPMLFGLSAMLDEQQRIIQQTDIRSATSVWLDVWGLVWNIQRIANENDQAYRQRIIYTLTSPRSSNSALQNLILRAFGLPALVTDDSSNPIVLNGGVPGRDTWGPTDGGGWGPSAYGTFTVTIDSELENYNFDQLVSLIQRYKAAGFGFSLATTFAPLASLGFNQVSMIEVTP